MRRAARRRPIIDLLNAEVTKILAQPETRQRLLQLGFEPAGGTPAVLPKFEQQERAKWGPLIKAAGLKGGLIPAKRICATHRPLPRNDAGKVDGAVFGEPASPRLSCPSKE